MTGLISIVLALGRACGRLLYRGREEVYCYWRCPDCGQKLRYLASRAGRTAMCPRCRRLGQLPSKPQALPSCPDREWTPVARVGQVLRQSSPTRQAQRRGSLPEAA